MAMLMDEPEHFIKYFFRGEVWYIKAHLHEEDAIVLVDHLQDMGGLLVKLSEDEYMYKFENREISQEVGERVIDIEGETELQAFKNEQLVK